MSSESPPPLEKETTMRKVHLRAVKDAHEALHLSNIAAHGYVKSGVCNHAACIFLREVEASLQRGFDVL
jgi:hypothetical protein